MACFSWSPSYLVGHAEIDSQHQALLAGLEEVSGAVRDQGPAANALLDQWLHSFARHAHAEERLMAALTSPGGLTHAHVHAEEHAAFLHQAMAVRASLRAGENRCLALDQLGVRLIRMDIVGLDFEMIGHLLREGIIHAATLDAPA